LSHSRHFLAKISARGLISLAIASNLAVSTLAWLLRVFLAGSEVFFRISEVFFGLSEVLFGPSEVFERISEAFVSVPEVISSVSFEILLAISELVVVLGIFSEVIFGIS